MKKLAKFLFSRLVVGILVLFLQIYWFVAIVFQIGEHNGLLSFILKTFSIVVVIYIINKDDNPAYKLAWVIPILTVPILGGIMYLYLGNKKPSRRLRKVLDQEFRDTAFLLMQKKEIYDEVEAQDPVVAGQSEYISQYAGFPAHKHTQTKYFSSGEECYEAVLEELRKAEHYIFMEYFIVKEGSMMDEMLDILKEKADNGVDVRFMYDDVGCISVLDADFYKKMESYGISCMRFNTFVPVISTAWNNRDHRKIMVIDGHTAFTGGFNLADEYINREERFGYWKDSGIMIKGDAVWNLTVMFLQVWNPLRKQKEDYKQYRPKRYMEERPENDGYVQPYSDTPLDSETVGENIYLNIISSAVKYLYITTPYLIIDNELSTALCLAAKRGVDVRIITPGIPDKKLVFLVSQSYYHKLVDAGIKIYEYTPGFIHAKNVVCDDKIATVGTVNWDYRSLYLHFECGVFLYNTSSIQDIYDDFMKTVEVSRQVTREDCMKPLPALMTQSILRVFSPLL
ncbi:MAG: cardiolipin synthase [Anaerostipes sp.]|nr:cardiolipin synthase [Anaerostipes sp.]